MTSPIDAIYREIFGTTEKSGTAFEKIAAIGSYLLKRGEVVHNSHLRGEHSKSSYQIDVLQKTGGSTTFGEAKDYSERGAKVGRPDLQKLGGALPDLAEVDGGEFWSVTGFTGPAIKYANAAKEIAGKPIELRALNFEAIKNGAGIVMTVIINATLVIPELQRARWSVTFTEEGEKKLKKSIPPGEDRLDFKQGLEEFFDAKGQVMISLFDLTSKGYVAPEVDGVARGSFSLPDAYIKVNEDLVGITELKYEIPFRTEIKQIIIGDDPKQPPSNYLMSIETHEGDLLKKISEQELKKYSIDAGGKVTKKHQ